MRRQISLHMVQLLKDMDFVAVLNIRNCAYVVSICYDHVPCNLRSGVPLLFVGAGKERLIQLLDYSSVASPQSELFSDWSRNKRVLRTKP